MLFVFLLVLSFEEASTLIARRVAAVELWHLVRHEALRAELLAQRGNLLRQRLVEVLVRARLLVAGRHLDQVHAAVGQALGEQRLKVVGRLDAVAVRAVRLGVLFKVGVAEVEAKVGKRNLERLT